MFFYVEKALYTCIVRYVNLEYKEEERKGKTGMGETDRYKKRKISNGKMRTAVRREGEW